MNSTPNVSNPRDGVFVVPDIAKDNAFSDHPDVTTFPNIRFLASSPIISPKGVVIGAYTILDDKPHEPLAPGSLQFLVDIAATVMDYLGTSHSKAQHFRSERMMVGLGSFLEGKGSLRNSWVVDTDVPQTKFDEMDQAEGHVNREQQEKQASHDMGQNGTPNHLPFRPYSLHIPRNKSLKGNREQYQSVSDSTTRKRDDKASSKLREASQAAMTFGNDHSRQHSPKDDYTAKVNETFGRAANLIRESIEVEAVVFFNANFGSQGALVNNVKSDTEGSGFESCSSGDEAKSRGSQQNSFEDQESFDPESSGKATLNPCEILGFSTSSASSINDQLKDDNKIALSESFLAGLLHRYPRGKIFNFGEDGTISSDDTSDGVFKRFLRPPRGKKYKITRKSLLRQDAQTLLQLAPDSRSIVFSPLWDSHKGRWYSGALTWTKAPHRVFTSNDELAFLLTFGTSVMAEVHRLGAHFADRAKADLLSGLSHELRSPLHGIFGSAELLNDTVMDALQREFIHTISSCAFTLLGSINQLLEYASINDIRPKSITATPGIHEVSVNRKLPPTRRNEQSGKVDNDTCVELDAALEDAVETVFAGYSFLNNSRSPLHAAAGASSLGSKHPDTQGGVKVILDIDRTHSWKFSTQAGAWHVILTNILGNALKFTQNGYIYISMKASPAKYRADGEVISSRVTVTVKDTGSGMDPDFLNNGLFTAFSQEDSMTIGNGIGLNITQRMILSLGGDIHVNSEKEVGTEVITTVTLNHVSAADNLDRLNSHSPITMAQRLTRAKTIGILGLGTSELHRALRSSLKKLCADWFSMEVLLVESSEAQFVHCDLYISSQEYLDTGNLEIAIAPRPGARFSSPAIIICPSPKTAHSMSAGVQNHGDARVLEFISQPCGPRKLAKALEACIKRQQLRFDSFQGKEYTSDSSATPTDLSTDEPGMDSTSPSSNGEVNEHPTIKVVQYLETCCQSSRETLASLKNSRGDVDDPLSLSEEAAATNHHAPIKKENGTDSNLPSTVLLVDDNDINLKILIAFMKKLKCDYLIAQNGEEALEVFKANFSVIAMIFMDISMPIMDGLESTRRIREFEKTLETKSRVMIAALTGVAQADMERDATGSGMDLFLTKPVRLRSLVPIVKGILPRTHALWQE
jgi:signal transduction histidine kinase/CheY-like chemotaxis protein